jgi:peptidoglycan-associated lipoprotein
MANQWLRKGVVILLAGLLLAGCAGRGARVEPSEPPADDYGVRETTRAPAAAGGFTFDAAGNPYIPGSNQLLARVFYFEFDRSQLRQEDLAALEMHADILRSNPERSVVIEGHADERGTREYNLALGERRANAIRSFLTSAGVSSRQIETVSYGEERPEDPGHNEAAWARNRRAIVIYR